jgi:hypothetical protein
MQQVHWEGAPLFVCEAWDSTKLAVLGFADSLTMVHPSGCPPRAIRTQVGSDSRHSRMICTVRFLCFVVDCRVPQLWL